MFITVTGQKGGVAKTCTSIHLASVWAAQGRSVCVVDADRNRSALAYGVRGSLPFTVVPVEVAAKATRTADVVITDGQASTDEEELRHLAVGSDLVLLPTSPKARAVEWSVDLAQLLCQVGVPLAVVLVKVDPRQQRAAADARRMTGWSAYQSVAQGIECLISKPSSVVNRINAPIPMSA